MKKVILTLIFATLAAAGLAARQGSAPQQQQDVDGIKVSRLSVTHAGDAVQVVFRATIDRRAARSGATVAYAPVVTDGHHKVSLPPIVVQGHRAAKSWERHEWAAGQQVRYDDGVYARNGETLGYSAEVPFQQWMQGARIEVETVTAGCCNSDIAYSALADNILPAPVEEPVLEPVAAVPVRSFGEILTEAFPFVMPVSEFDPTDPVRFYGDERDNALTVYYRINKYDIEPDFSDNRRTLGNLLAAIETIRNSGEASVERVVVAGFASPEGPFELNDRLAWERAVSVKEFIMRNTDMPGGTISIYNGSADWRGLRILVAQDPNVPGQREVLNIIDNYPVWDSQRQKGRMSMIRSLNGGRTYRYIADILFPRLRNGAFIRVYYDTK